MRVKIVISSLIAQNKLAFKSVFNIICTSSCHLPVFFGRSPDILTIATETSGCRDRRGHALRYSYLTGGFNPHHIGDQPPERQAATAIINAKWF